MHRYHMTCMKFIKGNLDAYIGTGIWMPWTSISGFVFFVLRAEADVVRSNIAVLVSTGLGSRAEDDFLLARVTCMALLKLAKTHKVN